MIRALFFVALVFGSLGVQAWWAPEWTQRKTITLNTAAAGANLSQPVTDAPVLLRLHAGNFPQFLSVRDGGADFRVVGADDKTPLKYHIERFDPVAQMAMVWVKMPLLGAQSTEQKLFLYFANGAANAGDDAGATYDVDTAAVFHFNETSGLPIDSTAYATPIKSADLIANPASIIGSGTLLTGKAALVIGDAPQTAIDATKGWTIETWVKFDALPNSAVTLFERGGKDEFAVTVNGGWVSVTYRSVQLQSSAALTAAQWHHVAVVLGPGQLQLFLDGVSVGVVPVTLANLAGPIYVGGSADASGLMSASLDELRIHTVRRSVDAIAFSAAIGGERNDAVVNYGGDESAEQATGGEGETKHASNFGIIINNVFGKKDAIVEQSVIVVCALMASVAIMVMFLKAVALSRAQRSSRRFLGAYQTAANVAGQLDTLIDQEDEFDDSPLFKVYRHGLMEIRARLSPAVGAAPAGLEEKSIRSIRAALDAVMVREGQRLNSLLVLLTIAISGGPFIGLLGTVVGVMVTFAAIAATGDINIATIAPGMAAALLATVAGLGVAIPALFGYNYLGAKAKNISADMHVFADEFVARLNEQYGR